MRPSEQIRCEQRVIQQFFQRIEVQRDRRGGGRDLQPVLINNSRERNQDFIVEGSSDLKRSVFEVGGFAGLLFNVW